MALLLAGLFAVLASPQVPPAEDPLTATIRTEDADRFADLFERTNGRPSAEQLQREYLRPGSYGVHVFTPNRIRDATALAKAVAAQPERYARAVRTCLPIAKQATPELRAIYLALHGLFPERPLPRIYLVFGSGNSGGTADAGAQVLGLEVLCDLAKAPEELRNILRGFFAHETVHTWQGDVQARQAGGVLLTSVLQEGAADFIALLVTGRQMDPARHAWALPREAELWRVFEADLRVTRGLNWNDLKPNTPASNSLKRWVTNHGQAPQGWPSELGYWLGQRIWERWYERQPDKRAAMRAMRNVMDAEAVLRAGRPVSVELPQRPR